METKTAPVLDNLPALPACVEELPPLGNIAPGQVDPYIESPAIPRGYRLTLHIGGRLITMSPRIPHIPAVAVALHIQRSENPIPGGIYRVWRIAQDGRTMRQMGETPAYYLRSLATLAQG